MVSLGFSPLRARREAIPLAAVQVTAQMEAVDDISVRRDTPATQEFDEDTDDDAEEDDHDNGLSLSSAQSAPTTGCSTSSIPEMSSTTCTFSTVSTTLATVSSSCTSSAVSSQTTTLQPTGGAVPTSSLALSSTTVWVGPQSQETGQHDYDDHGSGGCCGPHLPGLSKTDAKVAIAFGTIGAVGIIVALIWAAILIRRRRHRHGMDEVDPRDYPLRIGRRKRFDFDFNFDIKIPSIPRLPFSFASPLERFHQPSPSAMSQRRGPSPAGSAYVGEQGSSRSNTSISNEATQASYRLNGGERDAVPQGLLDEKRHDLSYTVPILDPEPVQQANIRRSVASWLKRSSRHISLRPNTMRWSHRNASTASVTTPGGMRSRPGSTAMELGNETTSHPAPTGTVSAEDGGGSFRGLEEIPPMPDLGLQTMYTNDTTPTPANTAGDSVTVPQPAFTKDDAKAYYKSMWAESSAAGATERMSAMSSWTDGTMRTSIQGGNNRESVEQAGLSPPPGYNSSLNKLNGPSQTLMKPVSTSTGVGSAPGSDGTQLREREELYALYVQK